MDPTSVAREVAEGLAAEGAEAVVLVGSHSRGDAGPESDVDLLAVGPEEFSFELERRSGSLVSMTSRPYEAYRRGLADPGSVCAAVSGWREAVILQDPEGKAASLIEEAGAWTWERLERRCDEWVGEEICSLAEEVHKLVSALRQGDWQTAAVQRSILAAHLAPILAVHRRILYDSENRLWDLVGDAMGQDAVRSPRPRRGAVQGDGRCRARTVRACGRRGVRSLRRAPEGRRGSRSQARL